MLQTTEITVEQAKSELYDTMQKFDITVHGIQHILETCVSRHGDNYSQGFYLAYTEYQNALTQFIGAFEANLSAQRKPS